MRYTKWPRTWLRLVKDAHRRARKGDSGLLLDLVECPLSLSANQAQALPLLIEKCRKEIESAEHKKQAPARAAAAAKVVKAEKAREKERTKSLRRVASHMRNEVTEISTTIYHRPAHKRFKTRELDEARRVSPKEAL